MYDMAISITQYVDITSGVGGGTVVSTRDLFGRFFTANSLLPPQTFIQFSTADEVGTYFGTSSEEYFRAVFYFSFISKNQTQAQAIQFARWVKTAAAPLIYPIQDNGTTLAAWNLISSGSFTLTMGGFTYSMSSMNFSASASLAAVATTIQTAVQSKTGGGAVWTGATITYSATYGGFLLVGGATDVVTNDLIVTVGGGGTDITGEGLLGWIPEQFTDDQGDYIAGAIWAPGSAAETITATLTASANASNNFGSFLFLNNLNLTLQNVTDAATWNNTQNVMYMYCQGVIAANVSSWHTALADIGGIGLTLTGLTSSQMATTASSSVTVTNLASTTALVVGQPVSGTNIAAGTTIATIASATSITLSIAATGAGTQLLTFTLIQYPEQFPMMIEAATNYQNKNSVQNYEFQQVAGLTASVTDDATAITYDNLSINYYGVTQTAGQQLAFYQQGFLQGLATNILDMGAYANEIWFKDAASAALMNLLLSLAQLPANAQGQIYITSTLQGVINQALNNGTISIGKTLTTTQQIYITSATGDPNAWYQVQNSGYWLNVVITSSGSPAVYIATYTLVYSKNDVIRKIIGTHTLI